MIDWERVATLRNEIGASDFDEVAYLFLDEAEEVIERLRSGSLKAPLVDEIHALKGSALNLGFSELASMLQDKERRVARGESISTDRIVTCYKASRITFVEGVTRLNSAA
jgi:HPt (histidine-containing phosphotransfer) domain-containing protein